ncbi:HAD-like domain-containing protein [Phycomyces nitens]|nr:HAD-like domain-containing protein [Phycomyces nitens]
MFVFQRALKKKPLVGFQVVRTLVNTPMKPNYAFAFDIDGVLIKGKRTIPEAKRALRLLNGDNSAKRHVPFVLLTNGGGMTEAKKAEQISQMLDIEIRPEQVVLSHSPMRLLVEKYKDKQVLIVGGVGESCRDVAKGYGFENILTPDDIQQWNPSVWPFTPPTFNTPVKHDVPKMPIDAVMMFHDARDWGRDLQIVLDAVCAQNGVIGTQKADFTSQQIPLYFSNNDIIWSTDFPAPRLGQGSFKVALEQLYETLTDQKLRSTSFGKPHGTTYAYAEHVIKNLAPGGCSDESKPRVYAVGDNPAADIKGANAYGWTSILVRTGVFTEPGNSLIYPADAVCKHVEEAVEWAIDQEEGRLVNKN